MNHSRYWLENEPTTARLYTSIQHFEYLAIVVQMVLKRLWVYVMLILCLCYAVGPNYYRLTLCADATPEKG